VIGSLTLAPLRIIGLATTLPLSLLIANIVKASAEKGSRRSQVYTKWHQLFLIKFLLSLAKFQIFILGISIRHTGEPASRNEAPMLVLAPHSTFIDGLFLPYHGMVTGVLPSPIAKADVHNMPLIGALLDMCNPIYVERGERRSRSSVVHEIKKRVNVEQPYPQCAIFPEGTNSNAQSLLAFKIGAFIPRGKLFTNSSWKPLSAGSASLPFFQMLEYDRLDFSRPELVLVLVLHSIAGQNSAEFQLSTS